MSKELTWQTIKVEMCLPTIHLETTLSAAWPTP